MHAAPPSYFLDTADSDGSSLAGDEASGASSGSARGCLGGGDGGGGAQGPTSLCIGPSLGAQRRNAGWLDARALAPFPRLKLHTHGERQAPEEW